MGTSSSKKENNVNDVSLLHQDLDITSSFREPNCFLNELKLQKGGKLSKYIVVGIYS